MSKTTDLLEQQADLLFENVSGWEQRTLERIGRRIKKMGEMPLYDVKSINLMAETKGEMEAIIKDLAKITGQNVQDVQNMYAEAIETQHLENSPIYDYRNKTFVPFSENKDLQSLVKAYSKSTNETMINLSKTKALGFIDKAGNFKNMQDSIYDVFGKATMTVATGTSDFHTAMRDAIEQLGGSGVRVHYGSGVTRRLDTVVRQNILWGAKQASVAYTEMIGEELDCDGIEIDYHSNPRPSHEFMQGKQYSLVGKKTINGVTYESADEALERLEDYGCLHYKTPIILGISEPRYSDKELAELKRQDREQKEVTFEKQVNGKTVKTTMSKTGYEWTQAMRQLETEARKEKEIINTLKASGDNIGAKQHRQRLKTINKKYNEIAEQTGIPARLDRMSIVKGGSTPQKPLTNSGSGGILKENSSQKANITTEFNKKVQEKLISRNPNIKKGTDLFSVEDKKTLLRNEQINNGNKFEAAYIYDSNGKFKFKKKGDRNSVGFTKKELKNMENCIITHNHPLNSCFSSDDIDILRYSKASELRASTKFGTYSMQPPDVWPEEINDYKKIDSVYNSYVDDAILKYKDKAAQEGKPLLSYLQQAEEDGTRAFCQKYGFNFRLEKYDE